MQTTETERDAAWAEIEDAHLGAPGAEIPPGDSTDQSNGMCLLDLPSASHSKPRASTLCVVACPQVATCPGPTSEPGIWTRYPGGVIGPVNASARADTSARQEGKVIGDLEIYGNHFHPDQLWRSPNGR